MTKPTKWLCTQRRFRSAWASAQVDLSLRWAHSHFVGFVTRRLIYCWYFAALTWTNCELIGFWFGEVRLAPNIFKPRHDKNNKMGVRPAKTQISLGMRPVWSESSLCAQWVAKDPECFFMRTAKTDQTGRMPRLIWVFAGRTLAFLDLTCRGSFVRKICIYGSLSQSA